MNNHISYFTSPIATYEENGVTHYAQMKPCSDVSLERLHEIITSNPRLEKLTEQVRSADDMKTAKSRLLPFVTPYGRFCFRNAKHLTGLSGYMPVDIDKLEDSKQARELRDRLAADAFLGVALAYVSPSEKGVKLLVRIRTDDIGQASPGPGQPLAQEAIEDIKNMILDKFHSVQFYIKSVYNIDIDQSGKDVCRACYVCHDPEARINNI